MSRGRGGSTLLISVWPSIVVLLLIAGLSAAPWSGTWAAPGQSVINSTVPTISTYTTIPTTGGTANSNDSRVTMVVGSGRVSSSTMFRIYRHSIPDASDPGTFPANDATFQFGGNNFSIIPVNTPLTEGGVPIEPFTFVGGTVQVTATYLDADIPAVNPAQLTLRRFDTATGVYTGSGTWTSLTTTVNTTDKTVSAASDRPGYFTVAAPPQPTPPSGGGGGGGGALPLPTATKTPTPTATKTPTPGAPAATPTLAPGQPTPTPVPPTATIPAPTATALPEGTIILTKGWNLISQAYFLKDPSVAAVFGNKVDTVLYFNTEIQDWDTANRAADGTWSGTLTKLEIGDGYWVKSLIDGPLTYQYDDKVLALPPHKLREGWNMIGYVNRDYRTQPSMNLSAYLASVSGKWESLFSYSPSEGYKIGKPDGSGFTSINYGSGYWINMKEGATLLP
ncbi:MAG: hypothetical protein HYX92_06025 [Chloroflexi bacterium]|nr:hypothetical protein [Chloroflexota bacterium]